MLKPICLIQSPLETRSGYGDMARDICRHIIEMNKYDVMLISTPWGATPMNALKKGNPKDDMLLKKIIRGQPVLPRQPEIFVHITIPNEFQRVAKVNIGITAGIETSLISIPWIEGCNRMDTVWAISEHSVNIIKGTKVEMKNNHGQVLQNVMVEKPLEILHNCVHTDVFKKIKSSDILESVDTALLPVKEKFNFLFVGHWLRGGLGEDRKNVGMLIKLFCETFKGMPSANRPGLILKTSSADFSILDREDILRKISAVQATVGPNCPNVYLLHGELTEDEMNSLYNHPKVKVHVSFTKGEGFGRPLLEACMSEKPVMASGWSGHLDFLNKDEAYLIRGELRNIEPGAVWENVIIPESQWFNVDPQFACNAMMHIFKQYDEFLPRAKELAKKNREKFSYEAIFNRTKDLFEQYVPNDLVPEELKLKLPTLKKVIPKTEKVE